MSSVAKALTVAGLYRDHHPWLTVWLRRKLGCPQEAADLAQDTFVRLLASAETNDKLAGIREPRSYLATIANRVVVDRVRRACVERAYLEALKLQPVHHHVSPETREVIIEALVEIDRLLHGLGPRTRRIFLMAQIDGVSFVEISRRLQLSVTTVRKHFVRAMTECLLLIGD